MKKILIVDDEVQIIKALSRMFLDTDYEIIPAESGRDALKLLEDAPVDMIICDMRMPEMDGYKLLTIIKEKYPKVIRIILSGYADEKPMYRALLHNVANLYVFKPWNNTEFLHRVEKLFAIDSILHADALANRIKDLECSSCIPENCERMISLIEKEDTETLITLIEQDPDISRLLIQVAKSAVYGVMPNKVKQAALYMGLSNLKCFVHWACIASANKQTDDIEADPEILWRHSYLTNRIFLFFYEAFLHKQPAESMMFAGLIHNIGLIILADRLKKKGVLKNINLTPNEYIDLVYGEYEELHQEIGAYLLEQWDLPFPMYEVALYHHRPLDPGIIFRELVSVVHIAGTYAWKALGATNYRPVKEEVFEQLEVSLEDFEKRLTRYLK